MVPSRLCRLIRAVKQELEHVAHLGAGVSTGGVPDIVVSDGDRARFDVKDHLFAEVGVGGHPIRRRVAEVGARQPGS